MRCSRCSDGKRLAAAVARLAGGALTLSLISGCGGTPPGVVTSPGPSDVPVGSTLPALPPGPPVPDDAQIAPGELIITSSAAQADVAAAVRAAGGELIDSDDRIGLHVARFSVDGVGELVMVRDALRAAGFDASVNPEISEPTTDS